MKYFEELGARVDAQWKRTDYDERRFYQAAASVLAECPPSQQTSFEEIVEDALTNDPMGYQYDIGAEFGQPPYTVYFGRDFRIEVLFWIGATPAIHQHGFSGAFHVLSGSSLHIVWDFEATEKVSTHLSYGHVGLRKAELLNTGDIREILRGSKFIHTTFHLHIPTVSIVVRTISEQDQLPQYSYLPPAIAYNPRDDLAMLKRREQVLSMLVNAGRQKDYESCLLRMLRGCDSFSAFRYLLQAVSLAKEKEAFQTIMNAASLTHPKLISYLAPTLERKRRQMGILTLREKTSDGDGKFILALLANIPDMETILRLIRQRYPSEDPAKKFSRCIQHLSQEGHLPLKFSDAYTLMLECLLQGHVEASEIRRIFISHYGEEQVQLQGNKLEQLAASIRKFWLFEPLFGQEVSPPVQAKTA